MSAEVRSRLVSQVAAAICTARQGSPCAACAAQAEVAVRTVFDLIAAEILAMRVEQPNGVGRIANEAWSRAASLVRSLGQP